MGRRSAVEPRLDPDRTATNVFSTTGIIAFTIE
jgi:hypothetical protein